MILNYNGIEHLKDCLPSAIAAAARLTPPCPVIVVDNRSTENDVDFIRRQFPPVEIVVSEKNDCVFSLNKPIFERKEDIVVILNNDMRFDPHFIEAYLRHFEDPDVFAVTSKVYDWDGREVSAARRVGRLHHFWFYKQWDFSATEASLSLDAGGGCAAFRRSMFVELGGFDPLYRPAYFEDTDLSYRAWRRGWKVVYEPASVIYHKVGATLGKIHGRSKITRLIQRNSVLFTVKNCGNGGFLAAYLFLLPVRAVRNLLTGNVSLTLGILDALAKIPAALAARFWEKKKWRRQDEDFLEEIRTGNLHQGAFHHEKISFKAV